MGGGGGLLLAGAVLRGVGGLLLLLLLLVVVVVLGTVEISVVVGLLVEVVGVVTKGDFSLGGMGRATVAVLL
ncbi:uncharacterized protein B0H64DRAFT_379396 [Chaetomium fimeti]|uniref:Uncharacterized protein n=1 Tax=Chaetomium fimeti TaxID=1854472 RepID=A0AAE0LWE5_9PEZI|nr:hypothetical protein B0H64DRAFT_379396 [Chaetomium fimeti]